MTPGKTGLGDLRARGELLGRERELATVTALLLRGDVGLVTLTGMGGIGKTRVATRLARDLSDAFPGGVRQVSLAAVTDAELVPQAVATVLGVGGEGAAAPAVFEALRSSQMLLVLDNLEHLLDAAGFVAELLVEVPGLRVLATSRAPLRLSGEYEVPLGPLAVPNMDQRASTEILRAVPSVALFVARASEVQPHLPWDTEALDMTADIVTRLDGWPLALELAAARTRLLSLSALRSALDAPLQVLTRGPRDLAPRQQTLRATLDWSYALLNADERALLARLAVFSGTFTPAEVHGALGAVGRLDVLAALVEHSWVARPDPEGNLGLLEPVREYALEKLAEEGAVEGAREAHARYYLSRLEATFAAGSAQADRGAYLRWVTAAYAHLRSALSWAVTSGNMALALRLERGLYQYWMAGNGLVDEGRIWAETLLLCVPPTEWETLAHLHNVIGHLALLQGEPATAQAQHRQALALARHVGHRVLEANTVLLLAQASRLSMNHEQAEALARDALAQYLALGDLPGQQGASMLLVMVLQAQSREAEGLAMAEALLPAVRQGRSPLILVQLLVWIVRLSVRLGRLGEVPGFLEEARALAHGVPSPASWAAVELGAGEWALACGEYAAAETAFTQALAHARRARTPGVIAAITEALARTAEARGDLEAAGALYRQVMETPAAPHLTQSARGALTRLTGTATEPAPSRPQARAGLTDLTPRESEVIELVARGETNALIARSLDISLPTVNAHLRTIYSKLGVGSRVLAVRVALEQGLVTGGTGRIVPD